MMRIDETRHDPVLVTTAQDVVGVGTILTLQLVPRTHGVDLVLKNGHGRVAQDALAGNHVLTTNQTHSCFDSFHHQKQITIRKDSKGCQWDTVL